MANVFGLFRGATTGFLGSLFDDDDEKEKKRRERFNESVKRLFGETASQAAATKKLLTTPIVETFPEIKQFKTFAKTREESSLLSFGSVRNLAKDLFFGSQENIAKREKGQRLLSEKFGSGDKDSGISSIAFYLGPFGKKQKEEFEEKLTSNEKSLLREIANENTLGFGLGFAGLSVRGGQRGASIAKKLNISPEQLIEKTRGRGSALFKSIARNQAKKAEKELLKSSFNNFEGAVKEVSSKVRLETPKKSFLSNFGSFRVNLKEKLVDSFHPIEAAINTAERTGKFKLLVEKDPRFLRDRVMGASDITRQSLKRDLEPVLKQIGSKNIDEFDQYLAARLEVDLARQGIQTAIDPRQASIFVDKLFPRYEIQAQKVTGYSQKILRYIKDNGLISEELYSTVIKKYPKYVPLNRVFDDLIEPGSTTLSKKATGSLSQQSVVLGRKGSEREIMSPISSIIDKAYLAVEQVERNRVAQSIAGLRHLPQFKDTIIPIRTAENVQRRLEILSELKGVFTDRNSLLRTVGLGKKSQGALKTKLNQATRQLETIADEAQTLAAEFEAPSRVTPLLDKALNQERRIFTLEGKLSQGQKVESQLSKLAADLKATTNELRAELKIARDIPAKGKHTISTFKNGFKEIYEVPEDFEVAAKNLNKQQMNILVRAAALPVRLARLGFTGVNIPFIATNFVRDQLFTIITSPRSFKTSAANPYNWGKGLYDSVRGGGLYDDFLASGGGWSTFFQQGKLQGRADLKTLLRGGPEKVTRTIVNPTKWVGAIEDLVSRFGEQPTRVQQFGGTLEALGAKGLKVEPLATPIRAQSLAVQAGRRNSTDFAIKGAYGEVLNSVFIYLNAGIQGSRTALRAVKTNPVGTGAKIATTLFVPVTAVTLWNVATPERKAAYEDIPEWERATNIIILPPDPKKDKDGKYLGAVKIPMPFNFAALTIPVRKSIEHLAGVDQLKAQDLLATFLGFASPIDIDTDDPLKSATSRIIPTAILPFVEAESNIKFFTGTPIVPRAKQDLPPGLQTRFDTSAFMKEVGGILNYSPAKLQNFVQSYSGGVGLQILNIIDKGMVAAGFAKPEDVGGRSILEDLQRRFVRVRTGRKEQEAFEEIKPFKEKAAIRSAKEKEAAEHIFAGLQELPRDQWIPKLSELKREGILNENIFNRIKSLDKADKIDLAGTEKFAASLPVKERAEFILEQLNKLSTSDHKDYLSDLKRKGILTQAVFEELQKIGFTLR